MMILGIESSCDETAAAVVALDGDGAVRVLGNVVYSQLAQHAPYGGVVPELAARAHVETITGVIDEALKAAAGSLEAIDLFAVTTRPGLIGSLLVGVTAARALAWARARPLIAVDHLEAHLHTAQLEGLAYPYLGLLVSGGHTGLYRCDGPGEVACLGDTRDDAAGEAFDKAAALLGLGYPGGPAIERAARDGDERAYQFPRPLLEPLSLDFSFSGLKTALLYTTRGQDQGRSTACRGAVSDLAAAFQAAVVDVLVEKVRRGLEQTGLTRLGLGGGVGCNQRLRERLTVLARERGIALQLPAPILATDNAAMVAALGGELYRAGRHAPVLAAAR